MLRCDEQRNDIKCVHRCWLLKSFIDIYLQGVLRRLEAYTCIRFLYRLLNAVKLQRIQNIPRQLQLAYIELKSLDAKVRNYKATAPASRYKKYIFCSNF